MLYSYQYFFMTFLSCLASVFPLIAAENYFGTSIWPLFPIGLLIGLLFNEAFLLFQKSDKSFFDNLSEQAGSFLYKCISLIFMLYFIVSAAFFTNYFAFLTEENALHETEVLLIIVFFLSAATIAASQDIMAIGRSAAVLGIFAAVFCVIAVIVQFSGGSLYRLFPVSFPDGEKLNKTMVFLIGTTCGESVSTLIFKGNVLAHKKAGIISVCAVFFGVMLAILLSMAGITTSGQSTWLHDAAFYRMSSSFHTGSFLRSVGVIALGVYFICALFKTTMLVKSASACMFALVKFKNPWFLYAVIFILTVCMSAAIGNSSLESMTNYIELYPIFAFLPCIIMPCLLLFISLFHSVREVLKSKIKV
ncbi:MAG: GerAB/ArcD/ProY family transporter [Christensenellaceae bacterium]|nr:GerAB/ArcD/ProY family transporter [Christensenellaceae bacterium]